MADGVEGTCQVYVEAINISMGGTGILKCVYEPLEMTGSAFWGAEALLALAEDGMVLGVSDQDFGDKSGPSLIYSVVKANWAFVFK